MEDAFFSSDPPVPSGSEVAEEVAAGPAPFTIQRVLLTLASLAALAWLLQPLVDEFRYHFSDAELVDIGDATNIGPENVPPLGAYVKVTGVLGNKAASLSGVVRPGSLRGDPFKFARYWAQHYSWSSIRRLFWSATPRLPGLPSRAGWPP